MTPEDSSTPLIDWGMAMRALPGQTLSGDQSVVTVRPSGVLVAVIDGVGHGPEAAAAARLAQSTLADHPSTDLCFLIESCHEALHASRGVVMSVGLFSRMKPILLWLGVGNVAGTLLRADGTMQSLLLRGGTVGYRLPPLAASVIEIRHGDLLVMATDGIRSGRTDPQWLVAPPQRIAERILAESADDADDSLVLVARYMGQGDDDIQLGTS